MQLVQTAIQENLQLLQVILLYQYYQITIMQTLLLVQHILHGENGEIVLIEMESQMIIIIIGN